MSISGLFVGQDTVGGGKYDISELSGREDIVGPLFEVVDGDVVTG